MAPTQGDVVFLGLYSKQLRKCSFEESLVRMHFKLAQSILGTRRFRFCTNKVPRVLNSLARGGHIFI